MNEFECLNAKANQSAFGRLVGISQPSVKEFVDKGILIPGQTLQQWLLQYCERIRKEASGRSGDEQKSLTLARIRDANTSSRLKEITIAEKLGVLVDVQEVEPQLVAMVTAARSELLSLPNKLVTEIKALHGIEIDESLIVEHIHESLEHLAGSLHGNTAGDDAQGGGGMGTAT